MESKIWQKGTSLQNRNRLKERTDLWLPRGRGAEEGRIRSLGLVDANYDLQNGYTISYYIAQGTTFNILG